MACELPESAESFTRGRQVVYVAARQLALPSKPIYLSIRSLLL